MSKYTDKIWDIMEADFPTASGMEEKIKFVLRYAILAPSTHNSQPWLFQVRDNVCKVFINPALRLPQADPTGRDLYISMGCMLENLVLAARYFGIYKSIDYVNNNDLVAEVIFSDYGNDINDRFLPFIKAIKNRINARGLFTKRQLSQELIDNINELDLGQGLGVNLLTDNEVITKIAKLTSLGMKWAHARKEFRQEMSKWMHSSFTKQRQGLPGYALKMPVLLSFIVPTLLKYFNFSFILSKLNYLSLNSAPAVCVISSTDDNFSEWLEVGRKAERIILETIKHNLNSSIYVASIEMGDYRNELKSLIKTQKLPQFLFCLGKVIGKQRHTPRLDLKDKLI